jgi:signal transduction histidine kinase
MEERPLKQVSAPPAAAELIDRIGWLIRLRWLAIVGVACTLEIAHLGLHVALAIRPLYAVLLGLALYNLLLTVVLARLRREENSPSARPPGWPAALAAHLALAPVYVLKAWLSLVNLVRFVLSATAGGTRHGRELRRRSTLAGLLVPRALWGLEHDWDVFQAAAFASAQISLDLFALAALLHFAGGVENPFVTFFLFHVIISSMLLSRQATFMQATLGFGLISGVALAEYAGLLRHYPLAAFGTSGAFRNPTFVTAQLLVLGTTLYLAAYMAGSIAARLRARQRQTALLAREVAAKAAMLEQAYERLSQLEKSKSQYMRKVAHELRGPLGTIQTALKVVLDGALGELPPASRDLIVRAERRAGELAQVTVDLLALSRAREGQLAVELVAVDVAALLREVVADHEDGAQHCGVALSLQAPGAVGALRGDPAGLRQLAGNLVSNAIRYTPRGGSVVVRLRQQDDALRLSVEDSGIGIPEEDMPRIFEEFYRAPNARAHAAGGTGLGLAIVKAVAEQHGGSVTINSAPGKGTCVEVELPATRRFGAP